MQCVDEALVRVLNNPYMFPVVTEILGVLSFAASRLLCSMKLQRMRSRLPPFSIRVGAPMYGSLECNKE